MAKSKHIISCLLTIVLLVTLFVSGSGFDVKAEEATPSPDPAATLTAAFNTFNSSQTLYLEYTAVDGDDVVHETVDLNKSKNTRYIVSDNDEKGTTITSYIDLKEKVKYIKQGKDTWEKAPADAMDLQNIGRVLSENGIAANIVSGVEYKYVSTDTITIPKKDSDEDLSIDCYHFEAEIPFASDLEEIESEEDGELDGDEVDENVTEDSEEVPETVTVDYFVSVTDGTWVYATTDEATMSIYYATPEEVQVEVPKEAKKKATLQNSCIVKHKGVEYKVVKNKKKYHLVVVGTKSKSKLTIESKLKILGKKYNVTEIGDKAFAKNNKLKTLVVKANITKIGKQAFLNDKKLTSITFKSKVIKSIGKNAFKNVSKKAVIKVPSKKKAAYSKLFKKAGFKGKVK